MTDATVFRRTLVAAAALGVAVILWRLTDLILLLLAGMLVAFIFWLFADFLKRRLRLPFPLALAIAVIAPTLFVIGVFSLFGAMMAEQFIILSEKLPAAFQSVQAWLETSRAGREISARAAGLMPDGSRVVALAQTVLGGVGTVLTSLALVLVAGVYLAAQPRLYGRGVLALVPPAARARVVRTVDAVTVSLGSWLKAQGVSMLFVGIFTGVALSLIGIPAAPAIGLVAGLCEFVPYLGTIVVAIPAIILGFSMGIDTGILTLVAIIVIQQVQGNIVTPLVQSRMADLPPALTIFSMIAAGVLLGPMGVILAVPLTVVGQTLVKALWLDGMEPLPDPPAADVRPRPVPPA